MNENRDALRKHLILEEGLKLESYIEKKSGKWHIAYGHLLEQEQHDEELKVMGLEDELDEWKGFTVTQEQADKLLTIDIDDALESLEPTKRYAGWTDDELDALDPERFIALISMAFQMGGFGVRSKFPSFVKAMKSADWDRAADEMLWSNGLKKQKRSAWYAETPKRCQEMADRMRGETTIDLKPSFLEYDLSLISDTELITELQRRLLKV